MLRELSKMEQRYQAVMAVQVEGLTVTEVALRFDVSRQTVHEWLRRYEAGGLEGLADRSHRPKTTRPHQGIGMRTPSERFFAPEERAAPDLDPHLVALHDARDPDEWITRKVSANGVITVAWQQISVGKHRGGHRVDVHVLPELLEVWDGNELIKTVKRTSKGVVRKKRAQRD